MPKLNDRSEATSPLNAFEEEELMLQKKFAVKPPKTYTEKVFHGPLNKLLEKFGEEVVEVITAVLGGLSEKEIVGEVADTLYRLQMILVRLGIRWEKTDPIVSDRETELQDPLHHILRKLGEEAIKVIAAVGCELPEEKIAERVGDTRIRLQVVLDKINLPMAKIEDLIVSRRDWEIIDGKIVPKEK